MIRVAYDFDGVLNNLPEAWTNYLNSVFYGRNEIEVKYYDMCKNFPDISYSSIMYPLRISEFWNTVELEPGAKEALEILQARQDVEVFIVTATSPESWTTKYEYCFKRLLPDFPVGNIILTSRKDLINCDILVEDNPEFLRDFAGTKILLNKSYNKSVKNDSFKHFNNHKDIVEFIKLFVYNYNTMGDIIYEESRSKTGHPERCCQICKHC